MKLSILSVLAVAAASPVYALTTTPVDGTADNGLALAQTLLGASSGLNLVSGSTTYQGTATQAGTYSGFDLTSTDSGEPRLKLDDGILLTSGTVPTVASNTDDGFTSNNGLPGDAETDAALASFPDFDGTNDANILSFKFTADPGITSFETQFVFGSEEFPEFPEFVDSFTVFLNGVNIALFPNGQPIVQQGGTQGFFNDNSNGSYGVEYDGLSDVLTLTGFLDTSLSEQHLKLVLADDDDFILDSGVFLTSFSGGTEGGGTGGGGITPNVIPLPAGLPLLVAGLGGLALLRRRAG